MYTDKTTFTSNFAGKSRRFCLRIGEIEALERECGAGLGAIALRLASHKFYVADVWSTIRLGLEGGGTQESEATAMCMRYQPPREPISNYIPLAIAIIRASLEGVDEAGKDEAAEGDPETSPLSTKPEE